MTTKRTTFLLPDIVHMKLKEVAKANNTSMSWLVVEGLLPILGWTQEELSDIKGVMLPKTFSERKRNKEWKRLDYSGEEW